MIHCECDNVTFTEKITSLIFKAQVRLLRYTMGNGHCFQDIYQHFETRFLSPWKYFYKQPFQYSITLDFDFNSDLSQSEHTMYGLCHIFINI